MSIVRVKYCIVHDGDHKYDNGDHMITVINAQMSVGIILVFGDREVKFMTVRTSQHVFDFLVITYSCYDHTAAAVAHSQVVGTSMIAAVVVVPTVMKSTDV